MLKLTAVMLHEEGPQHRAEDVDHWIRLAASEHPQLTVERFLLGERDADGWVKCNGYTGWFWFLGRGAAADCVARVCREMQCRPTTPVADLLEVTV